jgi:hypothetical protein
VKESVLIRRIVGSIVRGDMPLALAIEIEAGLYHAWLEASDADRYRLLMWTRRAARRPLIDAVIHAAGLPSDEFECLLAWGDRPLLDYIGRVMHRGLSNRLFQRAEVGIRALSMFAFFPVSVDVAIERIHDAGVKPAQLRRLLKDAGPPTIEEIVAAAARTNAR